MCIGPLQGPLLFIYLIYLFMNICMLKPNAFCSSCTGNVCSRTSTATIWSIVAYVANIGQVHRRIDDHPRSTRTICDLTYKQLHD